MASVKVVSGVWGSVAASPDPTNLAGSAVGFEVPIGEATRLARLSVSIFSGTATWRVIVYRGQPLNDLTQLAALNATTGLPNNQAALLGIQALYEAVVPSNTLLQENLSDERIIGPVAQSGDFLIVYVLPLAKAGLTASYVSVNAFGGSAVVPGSESSQVRAMPRFPEHITPGNPDAQWRG